MRPTHRLIRALATLIVSALTGTVALLVAPAAFGAPGTPAAAATPAAAIAAPVARGATVPDPRLGKLAAKARQLTTQNIPYSLGGHGRTPAPLGASVDCSGMVRQLYYYAFGVDIGSGTGDSMVRTSGLFVKTSTPVPGDVVLLGNGGRAPAYHAMVYVGNDGGRPTAVGSADFGEVIKYQYPTSAYWAGDLMGYWHYKKAVDAPAPIVNGDFIGYAGAVYRVAGGAPVYVSNWANVGGARGVRQVSATEFAALRRYPADGTFLNDRAGNVYVVAGGAPLYVNSWASVGGYRTPTLVDSAAIARAGSGGAYNHLLFRPADGTYIRDRVNVYVVAGGAPVYVSNWANVGGYHSSTLVAGAAISGAGGGGGYNHLLPRPADGTFVLTSNPGMVFRFAGGAPQYVSTWAAFGGAKATVRIDKAAVANAGGSGPWSHVSRFPADNTYLQGAGTAPIYRVVSGHPVYVSSWSSVGGPKPFTTVDPAVLRHLGGAAPWNHLR